MNKTSVATGIAGALLISVFATGTASAQVGPPTGAEIRGHSVRVELPDGTVNTVHFDANGTARMISQTGREVRGNWFVENQMICLQSATARECWPYQSAFMTGQPVTLTSDCAVTSRWTALSTEPPYTPPPAVQRSGERG